MEKMDISPSHSKKKTSTKMKKIKTKKSQLLKRVRELPRCYTLSQFKISNENINSFKSFINAPNDCVINALQLMGNLDTISSNILRISCVGENGFNKDQIEKIFILLKGHNFEFKSTSNFDTFAKNIETNLLPGHVVFAGYKTSRVLPGQIGGHVFILGRYLDGKIMYIDPQLNTICDINTCQDLIRNGGDSYYVLYNSEEKLTNEQFEKFGFTL